MTQDGKCTGCRCSLLRRDNDRESLRYLAENLPVTETGRQLSLEQVPTVGLRY